MSTIIVNGVEYFTRWDVVQRDQDGNPDHEPPPERPRYTHTARPGDERIRPRRIGKRPSAIQDACLKALGDQEMTAAECARRTHGVVAVKQALNAFQNLTIKGFVTVTGITPGQGGARIYKRCAR